MGELAPLGRPCNQSGLKQGCSCIKQLLSRIQEIFKSFESIVSQELILESLLFFIYINDFFDNLTANAK